MARATFDTTALLQASTTLRTIGEGATSMEEIASLIVRFLRAQFIDKDTGESALPLARFYLTRSSDDLEPELQDFARAAAPEAFAGRDIVCLTLLATAGQQPEWNDRRASAAHKAIPLPSVEALRRLPMVAQLVGQLGLDPRHLIDPDPELFRDLADRTYNVFFVPEARDCPYVPDQDGFVIPYGIRSVVGFGGVLPNGSLFAVVLFSRVPISKSAVEAFAAVALSVKVAILSHVDGEVFSGTTAPTRTPREQVDLDWMLSEARSATLSHLLDVRAAVVEETAARLEREVVEAEERSSELEGAHGALALSEARRKAIMEGALDCVIGMDGFGRITDFNRVAEATFGYHRQEVIGESLADHLIPYPMRERHRLGLARLLAGGAGPILGRRIEINALRRDGTEFPVELTVTTVAGSDQPLFIGYIRDITEQRAAAAALAAGRERLAHIARILQTSLLPPTLPMIAGIELAAAFRALGDGLEVGGDFYDVFELRGDKWGLSLGDVCGKGSDAAAVTALARYTLRAAAMRSPDPTAVLNTLNEAIHRQDPNQFCTAVYTTLDPRTGTVELALGGHPHPLLLTARGDVTTLGTTGQLLGPFKTRRGVTDTYELAPGDTVFLYSDGVTEARAGRELFGDDRLMTAVRASLGLPLVAAVKSIETAVLDFADELGDDLAILAARRVETRPEDKVS